MPNRRLVVSKRDRTTTKIGRFVVTIAFVAACGGKTVLDDGELGAGGSSTGGKGGFAAAAGAGGSTSGAGGTKSGVGGSTNGAGGVLGGAGGSAPVECGFPAGGYGGDVQVAIPELCDEISMLPCGTSVDACVKEMQEALSGAHQAHCGYQFEQILLCANRCPVQCQPGKVDPAFAPGCDLQRDYYQYCLDAQ